MTRRCRRRCWAVSLLERFGPQPYWGGIGGELQSVSREAPNGQIDLISPSARRSMGLQLKQPQGDLPSLERKGVKYV